MKALHLTMTKPAKKDSLCESKDDVELIDSQTLHQGFCQLQRVRLKHRLFNGNWSQIIERECMLRPVAVSVIAYDPKLDSVVLIKQFRIGPYLDISNQPADNKQNPWLLECVAGLVDDRNLTPKDTAIKELKEEAGLEAQSMELIAELYSSPGASSERVLVFYATVDASEAEGIYGVEEEGEDIKVIAIPYAKALEMQANGEINNAQCLIALQWLQINRGRLRESYESINLHD